MVMAQIYAILGEYDKAIDKLEYHLSIEAWSTPEFIEADPFFAPILEMPRYRDIVRRYRLNHQA